MQRHHLHVLHVGVEPAQIEVLQCLWGYYLLEHSCCSSKSTPTYTHSGIDEMN